MALIGDSGPEDDWIAGYREEWVVGTVDEVVDRRRSSRTPVSARVMLQHIAHDDLDMILLLGDVFRRTS